MEKEIEYLKNWLNVNYDAAKKYGEDEEIAVWETVIDKVNDLF